MHFMNCFITIKDIQWKPIYTFIKGPIEKKSINEKHINEKHTKQVYVVAQFILFSKKKDQEK